MSIPMIVLTTFPDEAAARAFARAAIDERLAACVSVLPAMQSIYRWEGKVEEAREHQLIVKTTASKVEALKKHLTDTHPYDVPEFLVVAVDDGSALYLRWLQDSVA